MSPSNSGSVEPAELSATLLALVFAERRSILSDYPSLFEFAWNSVVAGCIAVAFTLLAADLLLPAMDLFDILGLPIDFLQPGEPAFSALMGAAFGSGIGIARAADYLECHSAEPQ